MAAAVVAASPPYPAAPLLAVHGRHGRILTSTRSRAPDPPDRHSGDFDEQEHHSASVRRAFHQAAAYKRKSNDSLRSDDFMSSSTANNSSPAQLPTVRPSKIPDVSQDYDPSKATIVQDDAAALPGIWKGEARKDAQEADMLASLNVDGQILRQSSSGDLDVEIITRDGIIRRKVQKPSETFSRTKQRKTSGVNSSDFIGLDFSEKKSSRKPIGLAVGLEAPPPDSLPEIEIITRDGNSLVEVNRGGLYKPKVATWGIFERPADISRAYGGGRTIKLGEQLETEDEKKTRESRTRQLLDAYRKKIGLDVEPEIEKKCVKYLEEGNDLLKRGETGSALIFFEKVMQQMPYQSELHGSAALQWSLCLDSLSRFQEARSMYEKIASHPNVSVRKRAKNLLFGFQAMESLKMSTSAGWDSTPYRKYFDPFADGYNTLYKANVDEKDEVFGQTFMYLGFLMFPFLIVFSLVVLRGL